MDMRCGQCGRGPRSMMSTWFAAIGAAALAWSGALEAWDRLSSEGPSFDCAKASGRAQALVCEDPRLAQLDRELARLFALAREGTAPVPSRRKELTAIQRGWVKGRDDCWKSDTLRRCVLDSYVSRIHELRQGYATARSRDAEGISSGPSALKCDGLDALVGMTRVEGDPPAIYLQWRNHGVTLERVAGSDRGEYLGRAFDGEYRYWSRGGERALQLPEARPRVCHEAPVG